MLSFGGYLFGKICLITDHAAISAISSFFLFDQFIFNLSAINDNISCFFFDDSSKYKEWHKSNIKSIVFNFSTQSEFS